MTVEVTMPKLTDSMEEGRIVAWRVARGDAVAKGDVLAEVETDKAVMELESFWSGTVSELLHGEGDVVAVGEVIARIREEAEKPVSEKQEERAEEEEEVEEEPKKKPSAREEPARRREEGQRVAEADREPKPEPSPEGPEIPEVPIPGGHRGPRGERPVKGAAEEEREEGNEREKARRTEKREEESVSASPRARKLARQQGLDLDRIEGTGPGGRITVEDVERAASGAEAPREGTAPAEERPDVKDRRSVEPTARVLLSELQVDPAKVRGTGFGGRIRAEDVVAAARTLPATPPTSADRADEELPAVRFEEGEAQAEEVSFYQKAAIRRVVASKHVIPHFYVTDAVLADALLERKEAEKDKSGATLNHLILRASAKALEALPEANRSYDRGRWIRWKVVHLGIAVQTDAGLVVAVLRDAGGKDLGWISENGRRLVERARAGKLSQAERTNPTFTVSNLGAYDVEGFSAIINPPSALTLAVGSALPAPVVIDGRVEVARVMRLTLSCDHRVVDGVLAARFLRELKRLLETPGGLT